MGARLVERVGGSKSDGRGLSMYCIISCYLHLPACVPSAVEKRSLSALTASTYLAVQLSLSFG